MVPFAVFFLRFLFYVQVQVSAGRGKPSIVVDKDESLGKVINVLVVLI